MRLISVTFSGYLLSLLKAEGPFANFYQVES